MAAYCCRKKGDQQKFKVYLDAGKRIIKDRDDVLSLTSGSTLSPHKGHPLG